jgi:hypothetical protein
MYEWWKRHRELFPTISTGRSIVAAPMQQVPEVAS